MVFGDLSNFHKILGMGTTLERDEAKMNNEEILFFMIFYFPQLKKVRD